MSGPGSSGRHDHFMRPRRTVTTTTTSATALASMATVPLANAGPSVATASATTSTPSSSQYITRSATGSLSPVKREVEADESTSPEGEPELDDAGDVDAQSKLERKRERNRVKQRNLRLRRNIQMKELEDQVERSKRDSTHARHQLSTLTANEAKYASWIHELEDALLHHGLGAEVDTLRNKWGKSIVPITSGSGKVKSGSRKGKAKSMPMSGAGEASGVKSSGMGYLHDGSDPLATLAQAAMSTESSLVPPGAYHTSHQSTSDSHTLPPPRLADPHTHSHPPHPLSQHPHVPHRSSSQSRSQPLYPDYSHSHPGPGSGHAHPHYPLDQRRPSTSYTQPPPPWLAHLDPTHPALKRKRSVSGPIQPPFPSTLPPLQSLSEPATARHPFRTLPDRGNTTLPPIFSLTASSTRSSTPGESVRAHLRSSSSSTNTLPPLRPITAPTTPPQSLPPIDLPRPASTSITPPRGMSIDELLTPRATGAREGTSKARSE